MCSFFKRFTKQIVMFSMNSIILDPPGSLDESSEYEQKQPNKNDAASKPISTGVELDSKVVGSLNPTEVRWFYRSKTNEENSYVPFNGRDSLLIEMKYRLHSSIPLGEEFPGFDDALNACQSSAASVLNGYYEIFIAESSIKAIYWKEEPKKIARGTWFNDKSYTRIEEYLCDYIEFEHLKLFTGSTVSKPLTSMVEIFSKPAEIRRIRRGYFKIASYEDGPLPVNHLVFIVHGIGQKHMSDNVQNTNCMRIIAEQLLATRFKNLNHRPMFLPVEWRTSLKLDEETIDSITPPNITVLRTFLNTTFMDLMYYCSPKYRSEITDGFVNVTNALYGRFLGFNPGFTATGKISIVAHSLGSVIAFDVITSWSPLSQYEDFVTDRLQRVIDSPFVTKESKVHLNLLQKVRRDLELESGGLSNLLTVSEAKMDHLNFQVQNLFCLGSALGVFLALRGQKGSSLFPPKPTTFYNVFNVNDPVAYRLEPLIHPFYSKIKPLRIHLSSETQIPYSEMPLELYKISNPRKKSEAPKNVDSKVNELPKSVSPMYSPTSSTKDVSGGEKSPLSDLDFLSSIPVEDQLPYRIDYTTKESGVEFAAYFSASMAHLGYWNSEDFVLFILTQVCGPPM